MNQQIMNEQTSTATLENPAEEQCFNLPYGILGFPEFNNAEIIYAKDEAPFLRMRELSEDGLEFILLEPYGIFADYQVEISQDDLDSLDIQSPNDIHLLNVVTLSEPQPTVNLVAPLVFNKKTLKGKQVIISNYQKYSPEQPLCPSVEKNA